MVRRNALGTLGPRAVYQGHASDLGHPSPLPSRRCALAALVLAGATVGCGAGAGTPRVAGPAESVGSQPAAATAVALVATEAGLAAVPVGTAEPLWVVPGAVAAPDGSAVFTTRPAPGDGGGNEVLRIDPMTGAEEAVGRVPGHAGLHVAAVEPGGGRVALAAPGETSTTIVDFDPETGCGPSDADVRGPGGA